MLLSALHYSYINAKLHCLKSLLLKQADYKNLLQSEGVNGLVEYLKSTSYAKDIHESVCSYDELIQVYYKNLFLDYVKIADNAPNSLKPLLLHLYQRYELENSKVILRVICYEKSRKDVANLFFPLIKYQNISKDMLLVSKDLSDFIQRLKGTWYHDPLENSAYRFEKEGETFPLEMALDLRYYERLWQIVISLKGKDKKIARSILGIQLDALNIVWIIRFKENYHFSPEEILNYSLMAGCFITKKIRKRLAFSVDQKDIINNLEGTPYIRFLNEIDEPEGIYTCLLRYIFHVAKKNWSGYPFQIGAILAYIFFKEIEVRNLITITEARKIGLSMEKIDNYLVYMQ